MRETDSSGVNPSRNTAGWHGDPWAALTDWERAFLAPFRAAWFDDDGTDRTPGVRLEEPERCEDEFNGLEDGRGLWWDGLDFVIRDEERDIYYAGGALPSELFYGSGRR